MVCPCLSISPFSTVVGVIMTACATDLHAYSMWIMASRVASAFCAVVFFEILKTIFFENHPFITGWPLSRQCEIPCSFSVFFIVLLCVCVYLCVILCIFVFLCDILLPPGIINDDYLTFPWRFVALSAALGMLSVTPIMPILVLLSVVGVIRNHILNI